MKKNKRIIYGIVCVFGLFSCFMLFSGMFSYKAKNLVHLNGDSFALLLDGEETNIFPQEDVYLVSYTCEHNSKVEWDRSIRKLYLSKNTSVEENCTLSFKKSPNISEMEQGSYVAYEGNNGCRKNGTNVTGNKDAESKNSCLGWNANYTQDTDEYAYGYCANAGNKYYVQGWRIAYIEDGRAYLITAGSPECNTSPATTNGNTDYINLANKKALKYCNSAYVDGDCSDNTDSWAIGDNDFNKITAQMTGTNGGYLYTGIVDAIKCGSVSTTKVCGYNNDLIDNGGWYWFAASYKPSLPTGVYWDPNYRYVSWSSDTSAYGLRPIIRLSSSVVVTGGSGTMEDPYTIVKE